MPVHVLVAFVTMFRESQPARVDHAADRRGMCEVRPTSVNIRVKRLPPMGMRVPR